MEFLKSKYAFAFEGVKENIYRYRFISSVNDNNIIKIVSLSPNIDPWFNLAFGNLEYDDAEIPFVNDISENNNNDFDKVLATVFSCLIHFLKLKPDARIVFFGNTEHKQVTYKRKIAANLTELQSFFIVQGGYADFDVKIIEIKKEIQKRAKTVTRIIKIKDANSLVIRDITKLEDFDLNNCKDYHFVLIALA